MKWGFFMENLLIETGFNFCKTIIQTVQLSEKGEKCYSIEIAAHFRILELKKTKTAAIN